MANIDMISVKSSNLASIGYDSDASELHVSFKNGRTYAYYGVDQSVYDALMSAESHGIYFNANIRSKYGDTEI